MCGSWHSGFVAHKRAAGVGVTYDKLSMTGKNKIVMFGKHADLM